MSRPEGRRGYTLIETMVCVAVIGITCALAGGAASRVRLAGQAEVQRELAQLVLDYHAGCLSRGEAIDPDVDARLLAPLPDASLSSSPSGDVVTLSLRWRDPFGQTVSRSMASFAKGGGP